MLENKQTANDNADAYYFHQGTANRAYEYLGSHRITEKDGRFYYAFRTFAYRANRIEVAGDFNSWGSVPLTRITEGGIWEAVYESDIPLEGMRYKYRVFSDTGVVLKADPYAQYSEWGTHTASIIRTPEAFSWNDKRYLSARREIFTENKYFYPSPLNIYELHLGSWQTADSRSNIYGDAYLGYRELGNRIASYAIEMGYTHIELLPITEYPFDGSWGYQTTGYFSPTSRYGSPDDFKAFVDILHNAGVGVILDWVPAHFPKDIHGLAGFDGHRLYEYQGDDRVENKNWGTRYFDLGRPEVQSFLVSSAMLWLREFHIDGLRTDAVASMLYLDYDRRDGEWTPNESGGNENIQAIEFFKKLNKTVFTEFPDVLMIAEESTAWPQVTHPVNLGGLGFNFKWNMGWANDMFDYLATDPYFRAGKHRQLTFSMMYAFSENFILPVSHDEVVHGKGSLIGKMFGSYEQKFSQMRVFLGSLMTHPGKKMLFMGCEYGQFCEWDYRNQLEWFITDFDTHAKLHRYTAALNRFYLAHRELWEIDFSWDGFKWVSADRADDNTVAYRRFSSDGKELLCVLNFSPVKRENYKLAVGYNYGYYREEFNSDLEIFGGKGNVNRGILAVEDGILEITLPSYGCLMLSPFKPSADKMHEFELEVVRENNITKNGKND